MNKIPWIVAAILGTSDAQCTNGTCNFAGAPFQSTCFHPQGGACVDCPANQQNNYYALDATGVPLGIKPSGSSADQDATNSCTLQPSCADKFKTKYLPWPHWLNLLNNKPLSPFTEEDIPSFVALLYGMFAGAYKTLPIAQIDGLMTLTTDEDVFITLYTNEMASCQGTSQPACGEFMGLQHLNGMKFPVSKCTRLMFQGQLVYLKFREASRVTGGSTVDTCEFGMFIAPSGEEAEDCPWQDTCEIPGCKGVYDFVEKDTYNPICADFPAEQGFKAAVSCYKADGSVKKYRDAKDAVLDRALHDATCRKAGRIQFPCKFPAYCPLIETPTAEQAYLNATIACENEFLTYKQDSSKCSALQTCLTGAIPTDSSIADYKTSCIMKMCESEDKEGSSSAFTAAVPLLLGGFLALF